MFTLGGTIAMANRAADNRPGGVVTRLTGADLVAAVPGLADTGVDLDVRDALAVPSANLTVAQVLDVVAAASKAVADGAAGVVVTQGTDTLEETAYLIDLVWPHPEPIVVTGAMRNPTLAGPDGPANVLTAVQTAAAATCAIWVRWSPSTTRFMPPAGYARPTPPAPPRSPRRTPVRSGWSMRAGCGFWRGRSDSGRCPRRPAWRGSASTPPPSMTMSLLVEALATGCHGLIIAGYGVGHVPSAMAPVLGALAETMPVVLASRTGSGPVLRNTYGAVGSETDLQRRGLISAGLLDAYKARVLLKVLLGSGVGSAEISREFAVRG